MAAIPAETRSYILSQPLYRQPDIKRLLAVKDSTLEQGRCGRGPLAGLRFSRLGRAIVYPASAVIEFLENMPTFENTTEADHRRVA